MTDLIVNDTNPRVQYTVSSAAIKTYNFDFEILTDTDLKVYITPVGDDPDDILDIKIYTTDYTVSGAGDTGGGSITFTSAVTLSVGDVITILRDIPYDRLTDFTVGGEFKAATINDQLDRIVMQIQQVNNLLEKRGLTYQATETLGSGQTELPKLAALQYWQANGAGNLTAVTLVEDPDVTTLRSELASATVGAPGAGLIGYNDAIHGGGATTVDAYLKVLGNDRAWDTGDIRLTTATYQGAFSDAAKTGWVWMRDRTIGNTASGATERANADCHDLFVWLWTRVGNTYAPIFTSTGAVSSRGASAEADWTANKRLQLMTVAGKAFAAMDLVHTPPWEMAETTGQENVALTANENGTHNHTYEDIGAAGSKGLVNASFLGTGNTGDSGLSTPHNNMQPTVFVGVQIKL